ncbi:MAG: response regulator transcription factor [Oscillospiraceae bacterium]|nr:response regulator transcription factor [Oscillospiraceae bacterium]
MAKLLLIEDDQDIQSINSFFLRSRGHEVACAYTCEEGLARARAFEPECMVLDVNLPDGSGLDLCPRLRLFTDAPIIFLSCMDTEDDKIAGLLTGGDDYMTKPYSVKELEARILVCLRRHAAPPPGPTVQVNLIEYPPLRIDLTFEKVYVGDEALSISRKAMDMLIVLAQHPGECISAEELYEKVWGMSSLGDLRTVHVHIFNLRKRLEEAAPNHQFIRTAWGRGYCFVPPGVMEAAVP